MPLARSAAATTLPSLALFGASGTIGRRVAQDGPHNLNRSVVRLPYIVTLC
jgi:hypothetical protein